MNLKELAVRISKTAQAEEQKKRAEKSSNEEMIPLLTNVLEAPKAPPSPVLLSPQEAEKTIAELLARSEISRQLSTAEDVSLDQKNSETSPEDNKNFSNPEVPQSADLLNNPDAQNIFLEELLAEIHHSLNTDESINSAHKNVDSSIERKSDFLDAELKKFIRKSQILTFNAQIFAERYNVTNFDLSACAEDIKKSAAIISEFVNSKTLQNSSARDVQAEGFLQRIDQEILKRAWQKTLRKKFTIV